MKQKYYHFHDRLQGGIRDCSELYWQEHKTDGPGIRCLRLSKPNKFHQRVRLYFWPDGKAGKGEFIHFFTLEISEGAVVIYHKTYHTMEEVESQWDAIIKRFRPIRVELSNVSMISDTRRAEPR